MKRGKIIWIDDSSWGVDKALRERHSLQQNEKWIMVSSCGKDSNNVVVYPLEKACKLSKK